MEYAVTKVAREARQGRGMSRKIKEDLDSSYLQQIRVVSKGRSKQIVGLHSFENIECEGDEDVPKETEEEKRRKK